jgi:hypothetical protein
MTRTVVRIGLDEATIEDGAWDCPTNKQLERALDALTLPPAGYYPDRDRALALLAAQELGATVVTEAPEPDAVEGRVY